MTGTPLLRSLGVSGEQEIPHLLLQRECIYHSVVRTANVQISYHPSFTLNPEEDQTRWSIGDPDCFSGLALVPEHSLDVLVCAAIFSSSQTYWLKTRTHIQHPNPASFHKNSHTSEQRSI